MVKAYLEIGNRGAVWQAQATFEVRPEHGEVIAWGKGDEKGHAVVTGFEHREQVDGFVFVVKAEPVPPTYADAPVGPGMR